MTATRPFSPLVQKEIRALLPVWFAAAVAMVASALGGRRELLLTGAAAYVLGAISLGALSVGHEFACRTLAQLLAQPGDRLRLFRMKLVVLAPLLLALGGVAAIALAAIGGPGSQGGDGFLRSWTGAVLVLPLLSGLAVAPWLTMICRSPIAGVVFTLAIPAALWVGSEAMAGAQSGLDQPTSEDRALNLAVLWGGMLAVSAVASLLGWRTFMQLEATGGDGDLNVPALMRRRRAPTAAVGNDTRRARGPLPMLFGKELRLQSVTFAIAGLYVLVWVSLWLAGAGSYSVQTFFIGLTVLYAGVTAILVGSLASAEERAFGTIEWQALQPYPAWKQWTIKVVTALGLAIALALVLPAMLDWIHPVGGDAPPLTFRVYRGGILSLRLVSTIGTQAGVFIVLTVCALYVSSLCVGGLRAVLLSLPFLTVGVLLAGTVISGASAVMYTALDMPAIFAASGRFAVNRIGRQPFTSDDARWFTLATTWIRVAGLCGFVLLTLRFASLNHRSAEQGVTRTRRQLAWLAAYAVAGAAIAGGAPAMILWALASR